MKVSSTVPGLQPNACLLTTQMGRDLTNGCVKGTSCSLPKDGGHTNPRGVTLNKKGKIQKIPTPCLGVMPEIQHGPPKHQKIQDLTVFGIKCNVISSEAKQDSGGSVKNK